MFRRSFALVAVAALSTWACASTPEDPNAPQGCVIVDNSGGGGTQSQMYLIGINDGSRLRIGEVAMGRTTRFCTSRITMPGRFYVLVERPASDTMDPALGENQPDPIRSQDFVIEVGDVWTWDVRYNRLTCAEGGPGDC